MINNKSITKTNIKQKENADISIVKITNIQRQKKIENEANKLIEENFNALTELAK